MLLNLCSFPICYLTTILIHSRIGNAEQTQTFPTFEITLNLTNLDFNPRQHFIFLSPNAKQNQRFVRLAQLVRTPQQHNLPRHSPNDLVDLRHVNLPNLGRTSHDFLPLLLPRNPPPSNLFNGIKWHHKITTEPLLKSRSHALVQHNRRTKKPKNALC